MTDSSSAAGGHGPHDDQPHWTVDGDYLHFGDQIDLIPSRMSGVAVRSADVQTAVLHVDAHAALVRAVRDAAEVQTLRDQVAAASRQRDAATGLVRTILERVALTLDIEAHDTDLQPLANYLLYALIGEALTGDEWVWPVTDVEATAAVAAQPDLFAFTGIWYVRHADGTEEDIVLSHGNLVEDSRGTCGQFLLRTKPAEAAVLDAVGENDDAR